MAVAFSVIFMADLEKRLLAASSLNPLFGRSLSMTYFLCGTFQLRKFPFLVTLLTRSTLRPSLLVKCHPNAPSFSIQRHSKDLAFHLLEFSIHKPTSSPLKLFRITSFSELRLIRTNSGKEKYLYGCKHKRNFEQRFCDRGYPMALVHKIPTEVQFFNIAEALRNKTKQAEEILPLVTTSNPATSNLKKILMKHTLADHSTAT